MPLEPKKRTGRPPGSKSRSPSLLGLIWADRYLGTELEPPTPQAAHWLNVANTDPAKFIAAVAALKTSGQPPVSESTASDTTSQQQLTESAALDTTSQQPLKEPTPAKSAPAKIPPAQHVKTIIPYGWEFRR
jgi:hypothetical protein